MEIFPICTASYKPNELCNVCSPIIAQQSFPWQYKMQFRQITAVFWFCNTLACITSHWQIKILLLILVSWPKAVVSFVLSFNLVCLFGDAFSDKMPGVLHTRQVLEALQHYGHFSTALKNIKTDGSLFTAYPPFLQWHHALGAVVVSSFSATTERAAFHCLPLWLGRRPCFFWRTETVLSLSHLLCSTAILSSLLVRLNLQGCI